MTGVNPEQDNPLKEGSSVGSTEQDEEKQRLEERRRYFQGLADQKDAELQKAREELGEIENLKSEVESLKGQMPQAEKLASRVAEQVRHEQELSEHRQGLAKKYPEANVQGLRGTREEMESQAKSQQGAVEAEKKRLREEVETDVRAQYAKKYGSIDPSVPADQSDKGATPGGEMTVETFMNMNSDDAAGLDSKVFSKMVAEAEAKGLA